MLSDKQYQDQLAQKDVEIKELKSRLGDLEGSRASWEKIALKHDGTIAELHRKLDAMTERHDRPASEKCRVKGCQNRV